MRQIATPSELPETKTVGEQIKALRHACGLSLRKLAQGASINPGTLSRWEAGHTLPGIPELNAVLEELGASSIQKKAILRQIQAPRAIIQLRRLNDVSAFTSLGGDLLWALRQRRGWTQAETARAIGVTQAQIARWERGDTWPKATDLHTLCWHLKAHPDEVAALTRDQEGEGTGKSRDDEMIRWDNTRWVEFLVDFIHHPPGTGSDLPLLVAEQRLMRLAEIDSKRQEFATALLADVYAIHARGYVYLNLFSQARRWAERGLFLIDKQRAAGLNPSYSTTYWFGNVLTFASAALEKKRPAALRHAARVLDNWLPALPQTDSHFSWGQMTHASLLAHLRQFEEATRLGKKACQNAERLEDPSNRYDSALRWRDFAKLLLDAGQPAQGMSALSASLARWPLPEMPADTATRHHLLSAECLCALGDKVSRNEHVSAAESLVETHDLPHLQADLHRVAAAQ